MIILFVLSHNALVSALIAGLNLDDLVDAKIGTKVDINKIAFETGLDLVTSMLWGCSKAGEGDNSVFTGGGFREVEYKIFKLLEAPNISDNLPDMVTVATDASSKMVEWVMAEIMHNLSVKKKVQDELTKETFRLYPPLPLLIQRSHDETCKVGGYTIPKGTIVYMNIWAIHRDPKTGAIY
nr:putative cytochrome P450 [Tanacetum cinerariifolium]